MSWCFMCLIWYNKRAIVFMFVHNKYIHIFTENYAPTRIPNCSLSCHHYFFFSCCKLISCEYNMCTQKAFTLFSMLRHNIRFHFLPKQNILLFRERTKNIPRKASELIFYKMWTQKKTQQRKKPCCKNTHTKTEQNLEMHTHTQNLITSQLWERNRERETILRHTQKMSLILPVYACKAQCFGTSFEYEQSS